MARSRSRSRSFSFANFWWPRAQSTRRKASTRRLNIEPLEDRKLLAVLTIAQENQLAGSPASEWDIDGAGSDNIQGYAAQISVNHGERIDFKIDTDADDYRLDIYRIGYYGGMGARKVATVQPSVSLPQNQPDPIVDFDTGLVDAGNWRVSASWNVPSDATSGVYIAKLVREDGDVRRKPHHLCRPRRRRPFRHAVPDLRHHLAGLQRLRRRQPVRERIRLLRTCAGGQLQSPVQHARRHADQLLLRRRIRDGPLARGQRLRRQLYLGRRHRPARQRAAGA